MAYRISFARQATRDYLAYMDYLSETASPATVKKWGNGLKAKTRSLRTMPARCPVIPESDSLGYPYLSFIYFSHRVIYVVDAQAKVVTIVRVYHSARRPLKPDDLD